MKVLLLPLLLPLGLPAAAAAQLMVQPLPGSSDADLLAATMRRVAANPLDLDALLTAGEQSLKVDDLSGAASLFARAEKIDPRSGRVRAGMATILVRSERPGEALRYFAQAEAAGLDPRRFAADRALAYDLVGEQARAQADYRLALAGAADDETVRRYALSLGISGKGEEALRRLDPLLARTDRAAWRARAFILAMTGDQAGAERIAVTMMPAGMAQGLRPFFERLPSLPAVDRAFAVHFGEVRPTPERIADARLVPPLPPLAAEPRPVQVAAATPTPRVESRSERRRRERDERRDRGRVTLAAAPATLPPAAAVVAPPVQVAALSQPRLPPARARSAPATSVAPSATTGLLAVTPPATTQAAVTPLPATGLVSSTPVAPIVAATAPAVSTPIPVAAAQSAGPEPAPVQLAAVPPAATPIAAALANLPNGPAPTPTLDTGLATAPLAVAASPEGGLAPLIPAASALPSSASAAPIGPALATVAGGTAATPAAAMPVRPVPQRAARLPAPDSVLARIVASLSIPASELGVAAPVRPAPAEALSDGASRTAEALRTKAARDAEADAASRRLVRGRAGAPRGIARTEALEDSASPAPDRLGIKAARSVEGDASPRGSVRGRAAGTRRLAGVEEAPPPEPARKPIDAKKALADRKAAAERKAASDKAAEERRVARSNPSRIWVQVAGGANEGDLPKAWAATRAKAPAAFAGRSAYSARLRATNRVVTGPFRTDAEARAFVNRLAKEGVSAFPFTSDAGETVTRLPAK